MYKYNKECGPSSIDSFDDYYDLHRWHKVTGTGRFEHCHASGDARFEDYYDEIAEGIDEFGDESFSRYTVKSVSFPKSLKKIGNRCFQSSRIEHIVLPEGLQEIGESNFPSTL